MRHRLAPLAVAAGLAALTGLALTLACGGTGSSSTDAPSTPQGKVDVVVSDAPSSSWSSVDVVIRKIALRPVGGGSPVVVYDQSTASSPAHINLVQLDELGQLLNGASVPVGTYDKVFIQIDDTAVSLSDTATPPNTYTVAGGNVKVMGLPGFDVALSAPLVVTEGSTNAVELDFDLGHPLFIVDRPGAGPGGTSLYLVNFERSVRHRHRGGMAAFLLRHLRGSVSATTSTSITLATEHRGSRTVDVDGTNGTIFYDLDAGTITPVTSTTVPSGLSTGKFARIAARYQGSGSLTAVRVFYSADADKLRRHSPEGHVVAVDPVANTMTVIWNPAQGGHLAPTVFNVDSQTKFFFGQGAPIAMGTAFLSNVQRGFKVQLTVANPNATVPTAINVDIERAVYEGNLGLAGGNTGLTYDHPRYGVVSPVSASFGSSFTWWNFTYPTQANSGSAGLVTLLSGLGSTPAKGASTLAWNSSANAWDANNCVLLPIHQRGSVTTSYSGGAMGFTPTGGSAETVNLSTTTGSATLVYQVQLQAGIVTVSPVAASSWGSVLTSGTPARIFAVPTASGLQAYVVVALPGSF